MKPKLVKCFLLPMAVVLAIQGAAVEQAAELEVSAVLVAVPLVGTEVVQLYRDPRRDTR